MLLLRKAILKTMKSNVVRIRIYAMIEEPENKIWRQSQIVCRSRGKEMARNKTTSYYPNAISSPFDPLEPRTHNSVKWNISKSLFRFMCRAGCFPFFPFFYFLFFFLSPFVAEKLSDSWPNGLNVYTLEAAIYVLTALFHCSSYSPRYKGHWTIITFVFYPLIVKFFHQDLR